MDPFLKYYLLQYINAETIYLSGLKWEKQNWVKKIFTYNQFINFDLPNIETRIIWTKLKCLLVCLGLYVTLDWWIGYRIGNISVYFNMISFLVVLTRRCHRNPLKLSLDAKRVKNQKLESVKIFKFCYKYHTPAKTAKYNWY